MLDEIFLLFKYVNLVERCEIENEKSHKARQREIICVQIFNQKC